MDAPESLQRQLLIQLTESWHRINKECLDGQLRPPIFRLDTAETRLGQWQAGPRILSLGLSHVVEDTWLEVELTLRHEMAHQVVSEFFVAKNAPPHGQLFRRACRMLRLEESPRISGARDPDAERVLRRVQKLMNLAGSDNKNEARAAMAAASKLLLKHNLEILDAPADGVSYRWVGKPTGRVSLERKLMSRILQDYFFVQCLWVGTSTGLNKRVRVLEVMGRPHSLELAEYVHSYLEHTLNRLWRGYRAGRKLPRTVRNEYRAGVLMGFDQHLAAQQESCTQEGLVWLGDPAVDELLDRRYPHRGSMRRSMYRVGKAHHAGLKDGRQIRIRPGLGQPETPTRRGRLLS